MTKMRPTPAAAPAATAVRGRGPAAAFTPLASDPTWSNFLEPRTSDLSNAFDGDDNRGTHPTTLPPTFGGGK